MRESTTYPFTAPATRPQLLLSLTDNWQQTGGADEFVRWAGGSSHEAFFASPAIKQLYKWVPCWGQRSTVHDSTWQCMAAAAAGHAQLLACRTA